VEVNMEKLQNNPICMCNCHDAAQNAWCDHMMAHCLAKKIIPRYPRHIDPTPTAKGNEGGCHRHTQPGHALDCKDTARVGGVRGSGRGRGRGRGLRGSSGGRSGGAV